MPERLNIAIIGGGCSGALTALHLLRGQRPLRIHLVEPRPTAGLGLAYSTTCHHHLLNVSAHCLGVSPTAPQDFVEWLAHDTGGPADPDAFAPRATFGRYIVERLEEARSQAAPNSVLLRHYAEALDVGREGERAILQLNGGERLEADVVVLALGNAAPRRLPFFPRAGTNPMFHESAWSPGALEMDDPASSVILIGSGLTAVDAFIGLHSNGHRGVVHMISRRGLLPQSHAPLGSVGAGDVPWEAKSLLELLRELRIRVRFAEQEGSDWRDVIASLRGATNELWLRLTPRDRERFYRHAKAYWDVHRHRMAPQVAAVIADAQRRGTLCVHAGRVQGVTNGADSVKVDLRLRSQESASLCAARIINCTGSEQDHRRVDSRLIRSMFGKGWLQANPVGVGIRTVESGAVVDRNGTAMPWLYAIGPMRVGGLLETTAVPEIREQAAALSQTLLRHSPVMAKGRLPVVLGGILPGNDAGTSGEAARAQD
jgi:hydroxyacylglutathione hydrolase